MTMFPHYSSISSEAVAGWKGSCRTVAVLYSRKCVPIRWFSSFLDMKVYDFQIAFDSEYGCSQPDPSIFSTYKRLCCHCSSFILSILRYNTKLFMITSQTSKSQVVDVRKSLKDLVPINKSTGQTGMLPPMSIVSLLISFSVLNGNHQTCFTE